MKDISNPLEHLKWAIKFGPELASSSHVQRRQRPVYQPKPNPISHCELNFAVLMVIEPLVALLGLLQPFPDFQQELITFLQLLLYCRDM
jgi:hypothetical protein